jgi:thiol-disulfide isomerase/thioredoxin
MMKLSVVILCSTALTFFGECGSKDGSHGTQNLPTHKGTVSEITAVEARGNRTPNFAWTDASGERTTFDRFHTKVTILNFWATWCGPCRREIPDLEAIHKELSARGVKVLGVSVDRGASVLDDVATFVADHKMSYPVVIDNGELEHLFGNIRAIPTTFIIDGEGKIVATFVGQRTKETFLEKIRPYLN